MSTKRKRKVRTFYLSRDPENTNGDNTVVLISAKAPVVEGNMEACEKCGTEPDGFYTRAEGDKAEGMEHICVNGLLRVTGIRLGYGEVKKVSLVVVDG